MMAPPAIHNAAFWGKIDDLRAELAEGVSPDLAYSEEWSDFDDTGPRAFTMTPLHSLIDAGGFLPNEEQLDSLLVCLGLLLAAGANPNLEQVGGRRTAVYPTADISDPYARRVLGAGGFKKYERAHLAALTATFAPKVPALSTDTVRVVVAFCFHVGYY